MKKAAVVVGLLATTACVQSPSEVESTTTGKSSSTEIEELREDVGALLVQNVQLELRIEDLEAQLQSIHLISQSSGPSSELDDLESAVQGLAGQLTALRACVNGFMDVVAASSESVIIPYTYC